MNRLHPETLTQGVMPVDYKAEAGVRAPTKEHFS
jgi:hypothetical protein